MHIIEKSYQWHGSLSKRQATDKIILHHAAASSCTADDVHRWHVANGWAGIGYHFFVRKDGSVYRGRPEGTIGAHVQGQNWNSIGVCFEGNFETDTMPEAQIKAGAELVAYLKAKYPKAVVTTHKLVSVEGTACPGKNFPFDRIKGGAVKPTPAQNKEETIMVETIMVEKYSEGNAVRTLQAALKDRGYDIGWYGTDGICGDATVKAIRKFQQDNGLDADGICGPKTWAKLLGK
jgi:N-acetyl-anhydromuramyl-L-alanine amidase AmpD